MAITSLLLSNGVGGLVPVADMNIDPNNPVDPAAQHLYNTVCIQVRECMAKIHESDAVLSLNDVSGVTMCRQAGSPSALSS